MFNKVISLGHSCTPAYHIRKLLNQQEAYFFDWLVVPPPALLFLVKNGLMKLFNKPKFAIHEPGNKRYITVIQTELKVIFYHEFKKEKGLLDYNNVFLKHTFLATRLENLLKSQNRIIFIRHHIKKDECLELQKTLAEKYQNLCFEIIAVNENNPHEEWDLPGIQHYHVNATPNWHGNDNEWAEVFRKSGLNSSTNNTLF
jgi:hypothetical protein